MTVTTFASGANEASEIRGFALAGIPVGACASNLRETAIRELEQAEGPVFLDSGAFSEVRYNPVSQRLEMHRPITHAEWRRRLDIYLRLARSLGPRLSCVVPDAVGDQGMTLARLARFRGILAQLSLMGVSLLLPLQLGKRSHAEFYAEAQRIAGVPLVPAFTMKKAATSIEDAEAFLCVARPVRLHLLGMGITNHRADEVLSMIARVSPGIALTMDSNRLRAVTGRRRSMTLAEHALRDADPENLFNEVQAPALAHAACRLDYTDAIAMPGAWASAAELRRVAVEAGLTLREMHRFFADPDAFISSCTPTGIAWWEHPLLAHALDQAWTRYVGTEIRAHVRTAAIHQTFAA